MLSRVACVGLAAAAAVSVWVSAAPTARAQDGEALFRRQCSACHTVEAGRNKIGPSLAAIYGKKAGEVPDFEFSDEMKGSKVTWNDDSLLKYLTDPKGFIPGTKMVYAGLKNPDDAKAVVDYLKGLK
jgi:cytochrome c